MSDIKTKSQKLLKKIKNNKYRSLIILFLMIINVLLPAFLISTHVYSSTNKTLKILYKDDIQVSVDFIPHPETLKKINFMEERIESKKEDISKIIEKNEKVSKIEDLLSRYSSPMQGLGELMFKRAEECGGDYKIIVAIAGNESGFGRIPYMTYNPFGYLDGVQYSSWSHAVDFLSCRISQQFLKPCNNDLQCIINRYGGHDTDKEKWIRNIKWFINQL